MKVLILLLLVISVNATAANFGVPVISSDGNYLAQVYLNPNDQLSVYEMKTGNLAFSKSYDEISSHEICILGDSLYVREPHKLVALSLQTGRELNSRSYQKWTSGLACNTVTQSIAVGISEGPVELLNATDLTVLRSFPQRAIVRDLNYTLAISLNGQRLAVGSDNNFALYDLTSGQLVFHEAYPILNPGSFDFDLSGSLLAVSGTGQHFKVYSTVDGAIKFDLSKDSREGEIFGKFVDGSLVVWNDDSVDSVLNAYSTHDFSFRWSSFPRKLGAVSTFAVSNMAHQILIQTDDLFFIDSATGLITRKLLSCSSYTQWTFSPANPIAARVGCKGLETIQQD